MILKWRKNKGRDWYTDEDGTHFVSYKEFYDFVKELIDYPEKVVNTEAGQKALERAKDEIAKKFKEI